MGEKIANPFPAVEWARDAYQNASYMSVTMGYDWDSEKAEMAVQPRQWHKAPLL